MFNKFNEVKVVFFVFGLVFCASVAFAQFPSNDIFLVPLPEADAGVTTVDADTVVKATDNDQYDSQPYFTPDGKTLFYVFEDAFESTNIYTFDVESKETNQFTDTKASEFSPKLTPDGKNITAVQIEEDGSTQRLWKYDLDGTQLEPYLADIYRTGYYQYANSQTVVFVIVSEDESAGAPPLNLQAIDIATGEATLIDDNVGVGVQLPTHLENTVSFVERLEDGSSAIVLYNVETGETTQFAKALPDVDAHAWLADGTLISAKGNIIYRWSDILWSRFMDFSETEITDLNRLAVSPNGDWLAFVFSKSVSE